MVSHLLDALLGVPAPVLVAVVAVLVFGESAFFLGFVLPGETAALVGGFLSSAGHVGLLPLILVVVGAAVVGDTVGYEVGRHFGGRLLGWAPLRKHRSRIERARRFLDGRGAPAVFVGRFTAFLRAVVPGLAGLSRMRYRRFLVYNAAGGVLWGSGAVLVGYFAGSSYKQVERGLGNGGVAVAVLIVLAAVVLWRRKRSRRGVTERRTESDVVAVPEPAAVREGSPFRDEGRRC